MTTFIPKGYHSVNPYMVFRDARKAIEFYRKAFGASILMSMPGPNGKGVMHAELKIGDSIIMLGEESPQNPHKSAETLGDSPISLFLYVENVDSVFKQAVATGAAVQMSVQDMFWGDRMGTVTDPFGYAWSLATHQKDLSPQEITKGAESFYAAMSK